MTTIVEQIRPFEDEDRPAAVDLINQGFPVHRQMSVAEWIMWNDLNPATAVKRRYVAGRPAQAYCGMTDRSTTPRKMEGVVSFDLHVARESRNQGVGSALYELVLAFASERGAKRLLTNVPLLPVDEDGSVAFLTKRGFTELDRERPSYIELKDFDPLAFEEDLQKMERLGVRLFSYADIEDTEHNRRRFYELDKSCDADIPTNDTNPIELPDFVQFQKRMFERGTDLRLMTFAEKDNEWIGVCFVATTPEKKHAYQSLTGVLRSHRGCSIATSMKAFAYTKAKALGYETIGTYNHVDNAPMLAINTKFGFVAEPHEATYSKTLCKEQ